MRFYAGLGAGDLPTLIDRARKAEESGMHGLWEEQLNGTPFVNLAAVASSTKTLKLGSGIALAFTRSPLETALTALDMDLLTNGRFILGLGSGVQRLVEYWHGVPYGKPAPHLKENIQLVRMIMAKAHTGEPIKFTGEYYKVSIMGWQRPIKPVREKIPIYLAAVQAGMARLAGEECDGLLGHIIWSPKWIREVIIPNVEIGLGRSGRTRKDIELSVPLIVIISKDRKQARYDAAREIAFFATVKTYQPLFEAHGFGKITLQIQDTFKKEGHTPKLVELISDDMIDAFTVVGTVDEVQKRLHVFNDLVDAIAVEVPGFHMTSDQSEEYRKAIFETFTN